MDKKVRINELTKEFWEEFNLSMDKCPKSISVDTNRLYNKIVRWNMNNPSWKQLPKELADDFRTVIKLLNNKKLEDLNKELSKIS